MIKSLKNKLFWKQYLSALHMQKGIEFHYHFDKLYSILLELRNIDAKVNDEDTALILLVSLLNSFKKLCVFFYCGQRYNETRRVGSSLHSQELRHKASSSRTDNQASGLFVSRVQGHRNRRKSKDMKSFPMGPKPTYIWNYWKEDEHWKLDCPKKKE